MAGRAAAKPDAIGWADWKSLPVAADSKRSRYRAELQWIEPFVTKKPQRLRLKLETSAAADGKHSLIAVQASPQAAEAPVWKQLGQIIAGFKAP